MLNDQVLQRLYELSPIDTKLKLRQCISMKSLYSLCKPSFVNSAETIHLTHKVYSRMLKGKDGQYNAPVLTWKSTLFDFKVTLFGTVTLVTMTHLETGISRNHLVRDTGSISPKCLINLM